MVSTESLGLMRGASLAWFIVLVLSLSGCVGGPPPGEPPPESPAGAADGSGEPGTSVAGPPTSGGEDVPAPAAGSGADPGADPTVFRWQEVAGSGARAYTLGPAHLQGPALLAVDAGAGLVAVYAVRSDVEALWHEFWVVDAAARDARRLGRLRDPAPRDQPAVGPDTLGVRRLDWYWRADGSRTLLVFVHGRVPEGLPASGEVGAQLLALHHPSGKWEALGFAESAALSEHVDSAAFTGDGLLQVLAVGEEEALYRFAPDRPEAARLYGPVDSRSHLPLHLGSRGKVLAWSPDDGAVRLADLASGATATLEPGMWEYLTLISVHPDDGYALIGATLPEYVGDGPEGRAASGYGELRLLAPDGSVVARWRSPGTRLVAPNPVWSGDGLLAFVEGPLLEPEQPESQADVRPEHLVVWDPLADPSGEAAARIAIAGAAPERHGELRWLESDRLLLRAAFSSDPVPALEVDWRTGATRQVPDPDWLRPVPLPAPLASLPAAARPPADAGTSMRVAGSWPALGLAVIEEDGTAAQPGDQASEPVPYRRWWFVWDQPAH
ncbi:MAG TPA: hypothetical protein VF282_05045 [Bacillota bacterium]